MGNKEHSSVIMVVKVRLNIAILLAIHPQLPLPH
jgi:hypothetical protein